MDIMGPGYDLQKRIDSIDIIGIANFKQAPL